jgi:phenylacetate-CoA ligase
MFVHPHQVNDIAKRHPEIVKARLTVDNADGRDIMALDCETTLREAAEALLNDIRDSIQAVTKLRGEVTLVPPGTLPNDGKVIDDIRRFD